MSMRDIYRKVARENGVSLAQVKHEIQNSLNLTWADNTRERAKIAMRNEIPSENFVPTADEFIIFMASKIRNRQ